MQLIELQVQRFYFVTILQDLRLTFNDICCPLGFFLYICCPVAYICFPVVAPMAVALEQMFGLTTATSLATTSNGSSTKIT